MKYMLCRRCGKKGVSKTYDGLLYLGLGKKSIPSYKNICKYCKTHYSDEYKGK